jgi:hypothetical protein
MAGRSRRDVMFGTLGAGFARAARPVSAETIRTSADAAAEDGWKRLLAWFKANGIG